jgi:hypothetical protein
MRDKGLDEGVHEGVDADQGNNGGVTAQSGKRFTFAAQPRGGQPRGAG